MSLNTRVLGVGLAVAALTVVEVLLNLFQSPEVIEPVAEVDPNAIESCWLLSESPLAVPIVTGLWLL